MRKWPYARSSVSSKDIESVLGNDLRCSNMGHEACESGETFFDLRGYPPGSTFSLPPELERDRCDGSARSRGGDLRRNRPSRVQATLRCRSQHVDKTGRPGPRPLVRAPLAAIHKAVVASLSPRSDRTATLSPIRWRFSRLLISLRCIQESMGTLRRLTGILHGRRTSGCTGARAACFGRSPPLGSRGPGEPCVRLLHVSVWFLSD